MSVKYNDAQVYAPTASCYDMDCRSHVNMHIVHLSVKRPISPCPGVGQFGGSQLKTIFLKQKTFC